MTDAFWNRWKVTAFALMVLLVTVLATGLVVGHWGTSDSENRMAGSGTTEGKAAGSRTAGQTARRAGPPAPAMGPVSQPVSAVPGQNLVAECNRYASAQAGPHDKTWEVAKDAIIGGALTAGVGAAGGAIAGGGKGAGKGAAIGGAVGVVGGTLYGINENRKHDEAYRAAYARCMQSRGYAS